MKENKLKTKSVITVLAGSILSNLALLLLFGLASAMAAQYVGKQQLLAVVIAMACLLLVNLAIIAVSMVWIAKKSATKGRKAFLIVLTAANLLLYPFDILITIVSYTCYTGAIFM